MAEDESDDETLRSIISSNSVEGYFISLLGFAIHDLRDIPGGDACKRHLVNFLLHHEIPNRDLPEQDRQKLSRMRRMLQMILDALGERTVH